MNVTSKISVDLTRQNVGQRVNAVQGDGNTRYVEITLLTGGVPWTPPDGMEAAIAYMQPSGTKGMYMAGECYRDNSGTVHRCIASNTVYDVVAYPDAWETV